MTTHRRHHHHHHYHHQQPRCSTTRSPHRRQSDTTPSRSDKSTIHHPSLSAVWQPKQGEIVLVLRLESSNESILKAAVGVVPNSSNLLMQGRVLPPLRTRHSPPSIQKDHTQRENPLPSGRAKDGPVVLSRRSVQNQNKAAGGRPFFHPTRSSLGRKVRCPAACSLRRLQVLFAPAP